MEKNTTPRQRLLQTFGRYQVRYDEVTESFYVLEEAYAFFKQLRTPSALWDMSGTPYIIITKKGQAALVSA